MLQVQLTRHLFSLSTEQNWIFLQSIQTRVEGIPGNNFFPVPGIPGYLGKNSREFPGIQNSLHRKRKTALLLCKLKFLNVFWPYLICLWTYSSKNIDFTSKKNFEKIFEFWEPKSQDFEKQPIFKKTYLKLIKKVQIW